tara:strand:- start:110 stop:577 length:468 start_codon:yes stop_codon:yes gene_type:complete
MAILDKSKKPYIADEDSNVFIGLNLPINKSNGVDGYFSSSTTTLDAVKNNIRNLLNTYQGERLMQPNLGLNLRDYLFEPFTDDLQLQIQNDINETIGFWLPFVQIKKLDIKMDEQYDVGANKLIIDILFNITRDPTTLASIQVEIDGSVLGGGGY